MVSGENCFPGDIQNTCEIFINDFDEYVTTMTSVLRLA